MATLNCRGQLIDLETPKVMGILNLTPNSFYDGGRYVSASDILTRAELMLAEGADFIDLGAYSSKPSADFVTEEAELGRIIPIVELLIHHFPDILLSIDTFRSGVARACVERGAALVNDISAGLLDDKMLETVGTLGVPYVMMHLRGTPQTMAKMTHYNDLIKDILFYFSERIAQARKHNISDIVIDPGFGFAKTLDQNYEVMRQLELLALTGLPVLVGVSRKSMIYKALGISPEEALNGTTFLNAIALSKGAKLLRVHDVKQAVECVKLMTRL